MKDEVVKRAIVTHKGEKKWPCPDPLPMLDSNKKKTDKKETKVEVKVDPFSATMKSAIQMGLGLSAFVGVGVLNPDPQFLAMMGTFTLAAIAGY